MDNSMDCSDFNSAPAAKRRRLDNDIEGSESKVSSTASADHSSRLVVNTVLKQIATANKLLLVNLFMENLESFLQDGPTGSQQFVDTFLALDGCSVILHTLKRWVDAGTHENNTIDEETIAFVSTALGFLVHTMVYNRRAAFRFLDVKGLHITQLLMQICQSAPFDTVILGRAISIWGKLMTNVTRREDVLVENFSNLILNIMHLHPQCERIQRYGCKFFASLATTSQNSGETQDFDRQKLRQVVELALLSYRNKERTYYWCRQCTALYSAGQLVRHDDGNTSCSTDSSRNSSRASSDTLSQKSSQNFAAGQDLVLNRDLNRDLNMDDGEVTDSSQNSSQKSSDGNLDAYDDGNTSTSTESSQISSRNSSRKPLAGSQLVTGGKYADSSQSSSRNSSIGRLVSLDGGNTSSSTNSSQRSSARRLGSSDDGNTSSSTDSSSRNSSTRASSGTKLVRGCEWCTTDSSQNASIVKLAKDDTGTTSSSTVSSRKLSSVDQLGELDPMARDDDGSTSTDTD
ncbi:unnamed protein product [Cylindrotheca closterium]|uniref:Uncharacterized protein n=1 Tax=Cylindrotheca closterium TaxID=2856 RepID=A0AAD2G0J3_9STRA|nr:unnamed protein product [Cylindrotheca closterium]